MASRETIKTRQDEVRSELAALVRAAKIADLWPGADPLSEADRIIDKRDFRKVRDLSQSTEASSRLRAQAHDARWSLQDFYRFGGTDESRVKLSGRPPNLRDRVSKDVVYRVVLRDKPSRLETVASELSAPVRTIKALRAIRDRSMKFLEKRLVEFNKHCDGTTPSLTVWKVFRGADDYRRIFGHTPPGWGKPKAQYLFLKGTLRGFLKREVRAGRLHQETADLLEYLLTEKYRPKGHR